MNGMQSGPGQEESVGWGGNDQVPTQVCSLGIKEKSNCKSGPVPTLRASHSLDGVNISAAHFCSGELDSTQ